MVAQQSSDIGLSSSKGIDMWATSGIMESIPDSSLPPIIRLRALETTAGNTVEACSSLDAKGEWHGEEEPIRSSGGDI